MSSSIIFCSFISAEKIFQPNRYPWVVIIYTRKEDTDGKRKRYLCGGTLIASKYIISAGHCMHDARNRVIPVTDVNVSSSNKEKKPVEATVMTRSRGRGELGGMG